MRLVEGNSDATLRFDVEPHAELVVLETKAIAEVTAELLRSHNIPADRSADLRGEAPLPAARGKKRQR